MKTAYAYGACSHASADGRPVLALVFAIHGKNPSGDGCTASVRSASFSKSLNS